MIDFFLPNKETTTINLKATDGSAVQVEVIDVIELFQEAKMEADRSGVKEWLPYFVKAIKKFDVEISKTAAVMLVELATSELVKLKKSCSPEQEL
jgi:hypothetical protein